MKKLFTILVIFFALLQLASAQPKPQDSDTLWTKWFGDQINKVQFTQDGNSIIAGGGTTIKVYDVHTGNFIRLLSIYPNNIDDFDLSEDGKRMVTTSADKKIILWDFEKGDTIRVVNIPREMGKIKFINSNLAICTVSGVPDSNTIQIWDINTGMPIKITGTTGGPQQIALLKKSNLFALGTEGNYPNTFHNVELWDLNTYKYITRLGDQGNHITDLAFSPDGKYLASAGNDGGIKIWDVNARTLIKTLSHENLTNDYLKVLYSPSGNYLITSGGGGDNLLPFITKIWNSNDFNLIYQYSPPWGSFGGLDISKDSSFFAIGRGVYLILLKAHWIPTTVEEQPEQTKILYPNPAGNEINIPLESSLMPKSINMINSLGINVKKIERIEPNISSIKIDISMFPIGSYLVNIKFDNKSISYKFMVVR